MRCVNLDLKEKVSESLTALEVAVFVHNAYLNFSAIKPTSFSGHSTSDKHETVLVTMAPQMQTFKDVQSFFYHLSRILRPLCPLGG